MRMITTSLAALGFVGAMAVSAPTPTLAQGIYFGAPGVEFGIGPRYHRYYYGYDRPYAYGRPYYEQRYSRRWNRDWD
jgi:hypothetical protein